MIGSSFDAEALSAARRANELVHEAKMTWHEVLGQITPNGTKSNGSAKPNDRPLRDGDVYNLNDARDIEAAIILCTAMGAFCLRGRRGSSGRWPSTMSRATPPTSSSRCWRSSSARSVRTCRSIHAEIVKRNPSELRVDAVSKKPVSPAYAGLKVRIHLPPAKSRAN